MKIEKTYNWLRRDFSATLNCEACGHTQERRTCYDDAHFYAKVIPAIDCELCGQSTDSLGIEPETVATKYDASVIM